MEVINEASASNFIMKLSGTLYVIADAKALCSILYILEIFKQKLLGSIAPHLSYIKLAKKFNLW